MLLTLFKQIVTVILGNGFSKILLLGFEFYFAVKFGAAQYGLFAIGLSLLILIANLSLLGLDFGIIHYLAIYQEQQREDKISNLIQWSLIVAGIAGLITGCLLIFQAELLAHYLFKKPELANIFMIVGFAIPFEATNQCLSAIFRGLRKFRDHVIVSDFIRNICLLGSIPLVLGFNLNLEQIIYFLLLGSISSSCFGFFRLKNKILLSSKFSFRNRSILKELINFSYLLFVWNIFQKLAGRSQILLAGIFLTSEEVGVFGIFLRIILMFTFLQSAINQTVPVEFAKLNYLEQKENLKNLLELISTALLIGCTILAIPIVVQPQLFFKLLGQEYSANAWMLLPLLTVQVFNVGSGPIGQLLIYCRQHFYVFIISLFGSLVQVFISIYLMPIYGLYGAIVAESVTILTLTLMRHSFSLKILGFCGLTWDFWALLFMGMTSALIGIIINSLNMLDFSNYWISLMVTIPSYLMLIYIYSLINASFGQKKMKIFGLIKRK